MNPVKSCFRTSSRIIYFIYHTKKYVTGERAERNKNYLHQFVLPARNWSEWGLSPIVFLYQHYLLNNCCSSLLISTRTLSRLKQHLREDFPLFIKQLYTSVFCTEGRFTFRKFEEFWTVFLNLFSRHTDGGLVTNYYHLARSYLLQAGTIFLALLFSEKFLEEKKVIMFKVEKALGWRKFVIVLLDILYSL